MSCVNSGVDLRCGCPVRCCALSVCAVDVLFAAVHVDVLRQPSWVNLRCGCPVRCCALSLWPSVRGCPVSTCVN